MELPCRRELNFHLAVDCILDPFWEAFWSQFGAKLDNYTHFGPVRPDFGPLRAVKFKMQIRLETKSAVLGRLLHEGPVAEGWPPQPWQTGLWTDLVRDSTRQTSAS